VLAPLDAGLTQFGRGIRNSVQLAVNEANDADLIRGWKLRIVAVDDSSNAINPVLTLYRVEAVSGTDRILPSSGDCPLPEDGSGISTVDGWRLRLSIRIGKASETCLTTFLRRERSTDARS